MEKIQEKRAAIINDLSGFGRCSITVTLPILSVMGVHTACVPTALLSTHTGGFTGFTFNDLTQDMRDFCRHWEKENLQFDALASGYLGSFEQIDIVKDYFKAFGRNDNMIFVDPVMADDGKLYPLYTLEMANGMKNLCTGADVIVPNMTEAAIMLGESYEDGVKTPARLEKMCRDLQKLGAKQVVITGASTQEGKIGAACLSNNTFSIHETAWVPARYHGTGDVFASVLLGALLRDETLGDAAQLAVDYTAKCVQRSVINGLPSREGVDFEMDLWTLGQKK